MILPITTVLNEMQISKSGSESLDFSFRLKQILKMALHLPKFVYKLRSQDVGRKPVGVPETYS